LRPISPSTISAALCSSRGYLPIVQFRGLRIKLRGSLLSAALREPVKIWYDDVNLTGRFGVLRAVSQFCEANDVFALELARRMTAAVLSQNIAVTVPKVGAVRTNIRRQFPAWMKLLVPLVIDPFLSQTPEQIAASARHLLLDPKFEGLSGALFRYIRQFKAQSPDLAPAIRLKAGAYGH